MTIFNAFQGKYPYRLASIDGRRLQSAIITNHLTIITMDSFHLTINMKLLPFQSTLHLQPADPVRPRNAHPILHEPPEATGDNKYVRRMVPGYKGN
jgi:hypothetical protein